MLLNDLSISKVSLSSRVNIYIKKINYLFRYGEKQRRGDPSKEVTGIQLLSATAYQLKKPNQQLLIPITLWIGMEQAFIGADYTQVRS